MTKKTKKASTSSSKKKKSEKKVVIDITQHELVPPHYKLSEEEKKEFIKKYGVKLSDLPKIRINDPAIQHLDPKPGDIIKIVRRSPTAGETVYYRVVIEE